MFLSWHWHVLVDSTSFPCVIFSSFLHPRQAHYQPTHTGSSPCLTPAVRPAWMKRDSARLVPSPIYLLVYYFPFFSCSRAELLFLSVIDRQSSTELMSHKISSILIWKKVYLVLIGEMEVNTSTTTKPGLEYLCLLPFLIGYDDPNIGQKKIK